jgi:hypothetical protein
VSYGASAAAATFSGKAYNCEIGASGVSFGVTGGTGLATFSGRAFNCVAIGNYNFGASVKGTGSVVFSGTARGCEATGYAFGAIKGDVDVGAGTVTFSGTCSDCYATSNCFAAASGGVGASNAVTVTAAGTFTDCVATSNAFGHSYSGLASFAGRATDCRATTYAYCSSFTTTGATAAVIEATAVLRNCEGTDYCFASAVAGGAKIITGAVLDNCWAGSNSFVYAYGIAAGSSGLLAGRLTNCSAVRESFCRVNGEPAGADTCVIDSTAVLIGCTTRDLVNISVNSFGMSTSTTVSIVAGAYFQDCIVGSGQYAFGVNLPVNKACAVSGTFMRCGQFAPVQIVGGVTPYKMHYSFGYSLAWTAAFGGVATDCKAYQGSFASNGGGGAGTFSGQATRCTAETFSFSGLGTLSAAARLTDCVATENSYGRATGAAAAVLERCTISGIDAVAEAPVFNGALLRHCTMVASGAGVSPVRVVAGGTVYLYDCDLLSDAGATEYCVRVSTAAVATVKMDGCRSRSDLDPLLTNDLGSAINLIDPNYVVWT